MNPDYELLLPLRADERFELLRGRRRRTGAPVLLKRARREAPSASELAALQREAALAAGLTTAATLLPRWVDAPPPAMLVMEDPGGMLLSTLVAAQRLPVDAVLAIGAQIAGALAELHRRGFVHHGIRPEVILCDPAGPRAWLVDLCEVAGRNARSPAVTSGTPDRLAYVSPEQTGRTDRTADARSDLYALGVVLYELLTGAPPFRSADTLAQIHWHIAGIPVAPARVEPAIPATLSDLVLKLLAKTPEERYQSAEGLAQDLAVCAREWSVCGRIEPFLLGRRDIGEHLVVSTRLHGREREVHALLEAFEEACQGRGRGRMLLVEGYSGIGKTTLIQQLVRPIVRQRGYFISGKFDQFARGVPHEALIQAFRGLVRQLLTESEAQLARWREAIARALGANGGVLAEVIPEIEFIVGPQPAPVALGATEAQNRFQRVLQNFLAVLARPEHPLVLFLDDLQWADAATLALLEPVLTSAEIGCLMLMGAYRDNELEASPRLARTLAALAQAGVAMRRICLGPLQLPDLTALVAETLHSSSAQAEPLARLVHGKTGGNPFFVIQFLKLLEREGHLRFDDQAGRWVYRIESIAGAPLADNVIDLMTRSIQRLPHKAQYALTLAACIGNRFDRATLAIVSEQSNAATAEDIDRALAEGLVVPIARTFDAAEAGETDGSFAFLHDRVQQSAYALIPAERRQMVHLTVGRLLRSRGSAEQVDAALFDVVQHLNLGRGLIRSDDERREVAALNLSAGRRAKSSTAHDTALELFQAGVELLDTSTWDRDHGLCFDLHLECAESQYLCGRFDASLQALAALLARARTPIERARIIRLRSVQYENMARYADALASTREGLAPFGVALPDAESDKADVLELEIAAIETLRDGRAIAALVNLPSMNDPSTRMVMAMLTDIWSAAYILGDTTLARLISATMVRLSLEHGNVEESAYGYVTHAITVGPVRGAYSDAYEYGLLALEVNRRFDDSRRRAKIYQQFHAHVNLWCQPLRSCIPYAKEACRSGLDTGDFLYAAYGAGTEPWVAIAAAQDLAQFVSDYAPSVALIENLKNTGFADSVRVILNWARALQGLTAAPMSLSDATLDEAAYLQSYREHPFFACIHAVARLQVCTLLGDADEALAAAHHSESLIHNVPGTIWPVMHEFWHGLALATAATRGRADQRAETLVKLRRSQADFAARARFCAENFHCQALLLDAEIARLEGRERDAVEHCEAAIEFAALKPLVVYRALAHELLARLRLQRGQETLAAACLTQAREHYARWGAQAKVDAMSHQYPLWAQRGDAPRTRATDAAMRGIASEALPSEGPRPDAVDGLDLFSVLKATQAIAGEVQFETLLARLLHIAIENAGAERGALVLEDAGDPRVYATSASAADESGIELSDFEAIPMGIVNYVRRTGQSVVLAQADADEQHGADPYVLRHRPRSVMCLPLQKQGRAIGVLYLENRHVGGVFTPQRLDTLRIIATQAAISVESARLFAGLKQEIAERQQAQEQLGGALAEVRRLKDDLEAENSYLRRDLIANVSHDLRTPLVSMRGYLEVLADKGETLTPEQRQQYLGIAVRQSEHLATLIDELFELAKLDFKGVTLNREAFSFTELAADVVQKFQLDAQSRRVALQIEAAPHLPFVDVDVSLMERVLENLIGNALRHTPECGSVRVCIESDGKCLSAHVVDTGRGIPNAELPFVFDRYYRGQTNRAAGTGGAGLGLAITKRILELHGASIRVASDAGAGTRFSFDLPLHGPTRTTVPGA
jgi:predicted ATPase/signal transduction histidine kinase